MNLILRIEIIWLCVHVCAKFIHILAINTLDMNNDTIIYLLQQNCGVKYFFSIGGDFAPSILRLPEYWMIIFFQQ